MRLSSNTFLHIYEPVVRNGLALLGKNFWTLNVSKADRMELSAIFESLPSSDARKLWNSSAKGICRDLRIRSTKARDYLQQTAVEAYAYVETALSKGSLDEVFLCFDGK